MAMNLQAVLKIAAEVTGISNLTKLEGGLEKVEKAAKGAKEGFKDMVSSEVFQVAAIGAAAIATAMVLSTKAAMDFEESMAGVRKVVDGLENPKAFKDMESDIFELSKKMPIAAKGIADIFEAAGSAGIPAAEIKEFAETVGQVSIAFDLTAGDAATALAKIKTSLGLTQPELVNLADAMNHLSNNTASTAADLVDFTLRSGSAGKIAGLSAEQTAAFGAAMVSAGVNTEVAATSFNNMVKALGKGESMTERQISALHKLGFASEDAGEYEKKHTEAVEEESRQRLEVAELETNQLKKEIDRRYRDNLTVTQDAFDDENDAYRKSVTNRQDAQIKGLEEQKKNEIDAARQRAEASNSSADSEIARINKFYDERTDAVRDATDRELKGKQRSDRDKLQGVRDYMEDQKEIEINGTTQRFEETKRLEATRLKEAKEQAKAAAKELANEVATTLAKDLQTDAIGTITDVFARIRALPREQQLSVVSDLFGDEAKGLMPLIQNTNLLSEALKTVSTSTEFARSVEEEYGKRLKTSAQQAKLVENNLNVLAITFGQSLAPALTKLIQALTPVIEGFTWLLKNVPGLGPVLGVLGGAFAGIVAVAPAIASLVYSFKALGLTFAVFSTPLATIAGYLGGLGPVIAALSTPLATIAGYLGGLGPVVAAIGSALSGLGTILVGVFTGPVGWVTLLVAAGVAIYAFRDQIGAAFGAIGQLISQAFTGFMGLINTVFVQPMVDLWNNLLREPITSFFEFVKGVFNWGFQAIYAIAWQIFVQPYINLWNNVLREPVTAMFNWATTTFDTAFKGLISLLNTVFIQPWVNLWNNVLRTPVTAAVTWLQGIWTGITKFFNEKVITPIRTGWTALTEFLPKAMQNLAQNVQNIWTNVVNTIKNAIRGVLQFIANALNGIARNVNALIGTFNKLPGPDISYVPTLNVPKFADGGVVNGPTLAMVGEGGEREYIIPESKMARASANYLGGMRGNAAIQSQGNNRSSSPTIQIQTGPVLQQNNQQYVTIADMEKALTTLTDSLLLNNRTFGGRSYQGVGA